MQNLMCHTNRYTQGGLKTQLPLEIFDRVDDYCKGTAMQI